MRSIASRRAQSRRPTQYETHQPETAALTCHKIEEVAVTRVTQWARWLVTHATVPPPRQSKRSNRRAGSSSPRQAPTPSPEEPGEARRLEGRGDGFPPRDDILRGPLPSAKGA